jgi:hypothetical protein
MQAHIYATASNIPTGSALGTSSNVIALSSLSTIEGDVTFTGLSVPLTSGTVYAIVIASDTSDSTNYFVWRGLTVGSAFNNGSSYDAATWSDENDIYPPTLKVFK